MQQVQGRLHFAVIDEVDNILIDEARTPLIISGPAHDDVTRYARADRIARQLTKDVHFEVNEKEHSAHLTDEGVRAAEKLAGVESFYTAGNMEWPHLIDNSLKAHHLYKRDVNYVVKDGEIVIVDEFTGRLMQGRNWSDGLHQAVEAKEGVRIKEENQTLATITLQNFFKLYDKICGMTGTAMTEAAEFWKIYKLDVIAMPTNRVLQRLNHPDVIYRTEKEKYEAVADEIEQLNKWDTVLTDDQRERASGRSSARPTGPSSSSRRAASTARVFRGSEVVEIERRGRPILVGTVSIERSELISKMLEQRGIQHQVLNAKHHQREAEIVAQAGPQRRGDHRHEHGRPRNRHHPGRQSRGHGLGRVAGEVSHAARGAPGRMGHPGRRDRTARADEGRGTRGGRDGRPAHHRHRAPRGPADRLAASRPVRPPGRPRLAAASVFRSKTT